MNLEEAKLPRVSVKVEKVIPVKVTHTKLEEEEISSDDEDKSQGKLP